MKKDSFHVRTTKKRQYYYSSAATVAIVVVVHSSIFQRSFLKRRWKDGDFLIRTAKTCEKTIEEREREMMMMMKRITLIIAIVLLQVTLSLSSTVRKINIAGCVEIICGIERENVASSVAMRRRGGRFAKDSRWSAFCVEKQGKGSD